MPWQRTSPVEERIRFVKSYRAGLYTMSELCERYGVSRKTGYKWTRRFEAEGAAGLEDRSRAPHHCPHRMPDRLAEKILLARERHPTWGPKKLIAWLARKFPGEPWPAPSSAGDLLQRAGLVQSKRRRRSQSVHPGRPKVVAEAPNDVWTADYKGQFRTRNRDWCYPLTIADLYSRCLLGLKALDSTDGYGAKAVFEQVFREAGLPKRMLTDNGAPFVAARGRLGLTHLSVWWIRLGIRPLRIEPGHPEQNGAHERMHRTLKAETGQPPAGNKSAQQRCFNRFRQTYNHERPHEALGQLPPVSGWKPSPRTFPERLPEPEYPEHFWKRRVTAAGTFAVHSRPIFLSTALEGQWIGLDEVDDGTWSVFFCDYPLGRYDERDRQLHT